MRANCPSCNTAYQVDDAKIPAGGAKLKCAKCGTTFPIGGKSAQPAAVPLPGSVGSAAVPLPGNAAPKPQGAAVPLPGSAASAAVPLPGARTQPAVDLGSAVPLPGGSGSAAVPLPGARTQPAVNLGAAVPLPAAVRNVVEAADPGDDFDGMMAQSDRTVAQMAPTAPDDLSFDPNSANPDPSDPFAPGPPSDPYAAQPGAAPDPYAADPGAGGDPFAPPADPSDPFGGPVAAPAPAPDHDPFAADPGAGNDPFAMDFGAPPAPAPAPAPRAATMAAPAPRAATMAAPAAPEADPGADNDPFAMDFGAPPAAPAAPPPSGDDNMEFDPTAPAPAKAAADDLEADLSAPIAPAAPSAPEGDDLELLDFIDDAEAQAKAKTKGKGGAKKAGFEGFQVRNRAGKVFGPMAESDVVKMLSEGRLLGNEEISRDGENWLAFGSHGPFADALQKLMEAPGGLPTGVGGTELGLDPGQQNADVNERIKQIYGGRMAGIQIVDSRESVQKIKKRLPLIIASGVGALLVAFGVYLGFTPYGFFGVRKFFPKVIKEGSPEFNKIVEGRTDLAGGTYGSLKQAQQRASEVLAENDQFVDARALYATSTFALKERYGDVPPEAIARAHKYVEEMWVANPTNPDVVAAKASEDLLLGPAVELRPNLEKALAEQTKKRPQGAAELALELARSQAKEGNKDKAKAYFEQADGLGDVHLRALTNHALWLEQTVHDSAAAAALLEKAVKEQPRNGPAALELARLRLGPLAQPEKTEELLKPLADAKDLSTEEQGRVHAYLGMVRVFEKKNAEAEAEFKQATQLAPKSPAVEGAYAAYLLKRSAFDQAEQLFQDANAQRPDDLEVIDGLVIAKVGTGHTLEAAKIVAEASKKFPANARVALLEGAVAEGDGRLDDAEKAYQQAITRDPKLTRADLALGHAYLHHDKLKEAHATIEAALKKAPNDPELNTAWGEVAMAEGRIDDALGIFEQAIKLDNDSARAHLGRARALLDKKKLPEAQQEAELAVKQDEKLVGNHKALADVLFAEGKFANARDEYQVALKQDGKDGDAYLQLGRSLFSLGDFDGAQTAFENSKTMNRSAYKPHFWLALTHQKKHELTQAIEAMNKVLDNGGQADPEVHYNFGLIYNQAEGHYNDALDEFRTALKLRPSYVEVLEALGDAMLAAEDAKNAVGYFEQAYNTDGTRSQILGKIGDAYAKTAQWTKAIDAYNRHLKADASATGDFIKIGNAYNEMGKHKESVTAYVEATKKDPQNAKAWEKLGYAYKDLLRNREAVTAFKKYLALAPKDDADRKEVETDLDGLGGTNE